MPEQSFDRIEDFTPKLTEDIAIRFIDGAVLVRENNQGVYIELTPDEGKLVKYIDGEMTAGEIFIKSYHTEGTIAINALLTMLEKLGSAGMLANSTEEIDKLNLKREFIEFLPKASLWNQLTRWGIYLPKENTLTKAFMSPVAGAILLAFVAFYGIIGFAAGNFFSNPASWLAHDVEDIPNYYFIGFIFFILAVSLTLSFREIIKGSFMKSVGADLFRVGIAFYIIIPYISTDRRDMIASKRKEHIILATVGLLANLSLIFAGMTEAFSTNPMQSLFGRELALVSSLFLFFNLSPFFGSDLSQLLSGLTEGEQFSKRAMSYIRKRFLVRLFSLGDSFVNEKLFITLTVYSVFWFFYLLYIFKALYSNYGVTWISDIAIVEGLNKFALYAAILGLGLVIFLALVAFIITLIATLSSPITTQFKSMAMKPKSITKEKADTDASIETFIKNIPMFANLSDAEILGLSQVADIEMYEKGKTIIRQGDMGDSFYSIIEGEVSVVVEDDVGMMNNVATLYKKDSFGEIALLKNTQRTAHVIANSAVVRLLSIHRDAIKELAKGKNLAPERFTELLRLSGFITHIPLFSDLSPVSIYKLASKLEQEKIPAETKIITEGEAGDKFYILLDGTVDVLKELDAGKQKHLASLNRGDYFGEIALIKNIARTATVKSKTEVRLVSLSRAVFLDILVKNFKFAAGIGHISDERQNQAEK